MHHWIIYVATNFLSKTDFFCDHGESSLSTLDVNPGSRDPLRGLSGDPHLELHFEESEESNAFRWIRMMHHRIIYVATNFLSKIAFFAITGIRACRPWMWVLGPVTLFEGYQVTPTWSRISKNPKNRMHFDESEWCIIESFTLPATNFLSKIAFFAITGIRACRPWMWILGPVTLLEGYQVTPACKFRIQTHFEESEESNAFQWCLESLTLPPISLIHRLFSWSGRIELINTWSEAWVKCPLLKGYQVPEFGTTHSISALRFWILALHSWFLALRFC
jgi:hypothetical protein